MTARELRNRLVNLRVTVARGGGVEEMSALHNDLLHGVEFPEQISLPHLRAAAHRINVGRGHVLEWDKLTDECLGVLADRQSALQGQQQRRASQQPRKSRHEPIRSSVIEIADALRASNPDLTVNRVADIIIDKLSETGVDVPAQSTVRGWIGN